jgi:hypothetical protein
MPLAHQASVVQSGAVSYAWGRYSTRWGNALVKARPARY